MRRLGRYEVMEVLGRGYPSITRIDDQHIGIVYEGSPMRMEFIIRDVSK